jgi:hypothetical protein
MRLYRLKIEKFNSGKKEYTPQTKVKGWFNRWENIVKSNSGGYFAASNMRNVYIDEQEALNVFDSYKESLYEKKLKEVKSIHYREIE